MARRKPGWRRRAGDEVTVGVSASFAMRFGGLAGGGVVLFVEVVCC